MAITKPLSYKGCDPEVEKALRASMSILCYVSDCNREPGKDDNGPHEIVAYVPVESDYPYIDSDGSTWLYAVPVKEPVKWIMPPEKAIPILIKEGWKFDVYGDLVKRVGSVHSYFLYHGKFRHFGEKLSEIPSGDHWVFNSEEFKCIIEEK